jgi:hypothetical protein
MKAFISKPFFAIQLNRQNIREIMNSMPEHFVFYGLNESGDKEFGEVDELEKYPRLGGYYYHGRAMRKIFDGDWIIARKEEYDFVNNEYFEKNFIELPSFL